MRIMKISNPLWVMWCISVQSRSGWWEMCRLPLAWKLTVPLQVLYWGGEVTLIWGWCNSPEVTGDLMSRTCRWIVFCVSAILPMQMIVKWRSERTGNRQRIHWRLRSLWKTESVEKKKKNNNQKWLFFFSWTENMQTPAFYCFHHTHTAPQLEI